MWVVRGLVTVSDVATVSDGAFIVVEFVAVADGVVVVMIVMMMVR